MGTIVNFVRALYRFAVGTGRRLVRASATVFAGIFGKSLLLRSLHFIVGEIDTTIVVDGIRFDAGNPIPHRRGMTLLSKEPDTIRWIDEYVKEGDVVYDVGANIGVFSLYAAAKRKALVIAFEPMCTNYDILNRNIYLNGLAEKITAFNIALHDHTMISHLNLSDFTAGKAGNSFDMPVGSDEREYVPVFKQGVIGMSLDDFVENYDQSFPNHIKIDVDGNEPLIVNGMKKTILDERLKSVSIELNPEDRSPDQQVLDTFNSAGFELMTDEAYINRLYSHYTKMRNYFLIR